MRLDEVLAGVEKLRPWFHCIDLGSGIRTKTESTVGEEVDHPQRTWELVRECLPRDLAGLSVLDVGCNAGFYAVEAKRRGATRVLGVDARRFHVRQARFVSRVLGLDIEFRRMSVYDLDPHALGQFDITLALGLIYHCKHLVQALETLWLMTKQTLIIETAIYPPDKLPESFTHVIAREEQLIHTLGYVENPASAQEAAFNWFLPGVSSLVALLKNIGFTSVEVSAVRDERAIVVCHKAAPYTDSRTLTHLSASLTLESGPDKCRPLEELHFTLRIENTGFAKWLSAGEPETARGAVRLGAHLYTEREEETVWEYGRAFLMDDVEPSAVLHLDITLRAPEQPGNYHIEFDMVAEHLAWFEDLGSSVLRHELRIEPEE